ncbi:MAG: hypothetical protein K5888_11385 [Lachnospiraceae bacterium]|nr:hypothetical protein [Lachnospiraceae bacterium]
MIILRSLSLIFTLVVLPAFAGILPLHFFKEKQRSLSKAIILGYIVSLAILELIGIPIVLTFVYTGYIFLIVLFMVLLVFVVIVGLHVTFRDSVRAKKNGHEFYGAKQMLDSGISKLKESSVESRIYFFIIFALVLFQVIQAVRLASYDVDDAFYNAYARSAQQYGTLYRIDPSTGRSFSLDMRHAMALFPIFQAIVSTLSGIHLLIVSHKIMPVILIPLSYMVYYEISGILFKESRENRMIFMILINLFRIFGNISEYTAETFFFIRTWQGKSLTGNFIIPALIWLFLCLKDDRDNKEGIFYWVLIGILILAGGSSSSLAVLLTAMLTVLYGALFSIREKSFKTLIKSVIACVPGMIYVLIYIFN